MGCFGPSVGCSGCLIVLAAAFVVVVATALAADRLGDRGLIDDDRP